MPIYPVGYYVYAYIRSKDSKTAKAGTPYYIGKGCGKRMYAKHGNHITVPKNKNYIIILESNLTNLGALALERRYIKWYGRIATNTGILHNFTEGGEGVSGFKHTEETKHKLSINLKGKPLSEEHCKRIGVAHKGKSISEEQRKNHSLKMSGRKQSPEHIAKRTDKTKGMKYKSHDKIQCPHCGKIGGSSNMKRWHFDNCKSLELITDIS